MMPCWTSCCPTRPTCSNKGADDRWAYGTVLRYKGQFFKVIVQQGVRWSPEQATAAYALCDRDGNLVEE